MGGNCTKNCSSDDVECYVLDDNGYVVVSPRYKETGRFFGQVNGWLMQRLINDNIYEPVTIFDYQAICFEVVREPDSGTRILSVSSALRKKTFLNILITAFPSNSTIRCFYNKDIYSFDIQPGQNSSTVYSKRVFAVV